MSQNASSGERTARFRLYLGALLRAISKVPPGKKLNITALRQPLRISQYEALVGIEQLILEGRLDRATLRPSTDPRRSTVEKVEAFIADPPIAELRKQVSAADPERRASFEEQLLRVSRGEVGIAPNIRISKPAPDRTLGGVTGAINL